MLFGVILLKSEAKNTNKASTDPLTGGGATLQRARKRGVARESGASGLFLRA